jgi:hypothetical protein
MTSFIIMLAAEHCPDLFANVAPSKDELLEIHRSKSRFMSQKPTTAIQQAFSMVFHHLILIVYLEREIDTRYERKRPVSF